MAEKAEDRNFDKADEVRVFPKGKVELITIGGMVDYAKKAS